jgi:hypothetical protein
VRSLADASVSYLTDKENHELSDARILGSGGFVSAILQRSERGLVRKYLARRPLEELMALAAKRSGVEAELISSRSRQKKYSQARSLLAWLAVEEEGYPAAVVARFLGISRVGVKKALERWPKSES